MAKCYRYTGTDARDYPTLGFSVTPGDVLYLDGRAPDERFVEVEQPEQSGEAADWRNPLPAEPAGEELKQPNKAAPAADWTAFAEAHGGFEQATGTAPADATRKAIVDHYAANPVDAEQEQRTESEREADEQAALGRQQIADATVNADTPKE